MKLVLFYKCTNFIHVKPVWFYKYTGFINVKLVYIVLQKYHTRKTSMV